MKDGRNVKIIRKAFEKRYRGIPGYYFFKVLDKIIEYGELSKEDGVILDYGCGYQYLKKRVEHAHGRQLPHYVGYDAVKELSDVDDFRSVRPKKIVCSAVLEHMNPKEIDKLMRDFMKMAPDAVLIVFVPTENIVSRIGMVLTGHRHAHDFHETKYRDINRIVEKYYSVDKRCYVMFRMAQVTRYKPKPANAWGRQ